MKAKEFIKQVNELSFGDNDEVEIEEGIVTFICKDKNSIAYNTRLRIDEAFL